jgi:hypothetical protein
MAHRMITIRGTWKRKNTEPFEVREYRTKFIRRVEYFGGTATIRARRKGVTPGDAEGTYSVTLPFTAQFAFGYNRGRTARKVVEGIMLSAMCRPPTLTTTGVIVGNVEYDDDVVGLL